MTEPVTETELYKRVVVTALDCPYLERYWLDRDVYVCDGKLWDIPKELAELCASSDHKKCAYFLRKRKP